MKTPFTLELMMCIRIKFNLDFQYKIPLLMDLNAIDVK